MRFTIVFALAHLATLGTCSQWKKVLQDYNYPGSVDAESSPPYHVQKNPKPYGVVHEKARHNQKLGAKRVQIKYGKFHVPSMMDANGMVDYLQVKTPMPCKDCTVTFMQAGLEYPDGSYANANTSLWLHHTVFIDLSQPDSVCGLDYYGHGLRWFASGNERTPMNAANNGKIPTGYYIAPDSYNIMLVELMNQEMKPQEAVMTVTYEYVPGFPMKWYKTRPLWLDIAGCHIESDMPCKTNTTFEYEMNPSYKSKYEGTIVGQGGHVHDGGVHIATYNNDKTSCSNLPTYGINPGYISPKDSMMVKMGACKGMMSRAEDSSSSQALTWCGLTTWQRRQHISSISTCHAPNGAVKRGDILKNKAWYNLTEYAPMLNNDGTLADIMGINLVFLAENLSLADLMGYLESSIL